MLEIKEEYKVSKYCESIIKNKRAILYHKLYGKTIKISEECWKVIKENLDAGYEIQDIYRAVDDSDKDYFEKLFPALINNKILIKKDEQEPLEKIVNVDFDITHRCNLSCVHCCVDAANRNEEEYLSTQEIFKIIDELAKLSLKSITISGGEAMMRKDFFEISRYLREHYNGFCSLMTNGTLIHEKNVAELVKLYDAFDISLDGFDEESCSKIRGKGVFAKVIHSVELLKENGVSPDKISLSMVETKLNYDKTGEFEKLNERLGTKPMLREFSPIGRGKENGKELQLETVEGWAEIGPEDSLYARTCTAGSRRIAINYDGAIYPCMLLNAEEFCLGNVREISNLCDFIDKEEFKHTSGFANLLKLMPENSEKCSGCEYHMFCCYCLQERYESLQNDTFDSYCSEIKRGRCNIWL